MQALQSESGNGYGSIIIGRWLIHVIMAQITPGAQWHAISLAELSYAGAIPEYNSSDVELLREYATRLLKADSAKYAQRM